MRFHVIRLRDAWQWAVGAILLIFAIGLAVGQSLPQPEARPAFAGASDEPSATVSQTPAPAPAPSATLVTVDLFAPPQGEAEQTPAPAPVGDFSVQVLAVPTPPPVSRARVLIYHTHTYEAYEPTDIHSYTKTETWRTKNNDCNVVRVGAELSALLRALGYEVTHDTTAHEPPDLSAAYSRSLTMLENYAAAGETFDLYIDLHRDAYMDSMAGKNTVAAGGTQIARLMFLVGKGTGQTGAGFTDRPDFEANLAIAQQMTAHLNDQVENLCRAISVKSGRFNQHVAPRCVLVEAGNNKNTLEHVLAAMPYLADAIDAWFLSNGR